MNENSPLLHSRSNSQRIDRTTLRRVLYVVVPLVVVAIVTIGILISSNKSSGGSNVAPTAADEPTAAPTVVGLSDAELLTMQPHFEEKMHPVPPKLVKRSDFNRSLPTNEFWSNLMAADGHGLNAGAGEITLSPYTIRSLPKRFEISYGDSRRVATKSAITEYFNVDVSFSAYSHKVVNTSSSDSLLLGDGNSTSRTVLSFDVLSVLLQYSYEDDNQYMRIPMVRGSPYITVEYQNVLPVLEFNASILSINGERVKLNDKQSPKRMLQTWTSKRFELEIEVYGAGESARGTGKCLQRWILYFEKIRTLQLQFSDELDYRPYNCRGELTTPTNIRLVDTDFYSGVARLAIVPQKSAVEVLDSSASIYPVSSAITTDVNETSATFSFCWKTKQFPDSSPATKLLMMANPHHVATLQTESKLFQVLGSLGHRTLKSNMTAVVGSCWEMQEVLPAVHFQERNVSISPQQIEAIKFSLANDSNYTPEADDPYFFGKEIARQARLVLIADQLDEHKLRDNILNRLEKWVTPWMLGQNSDHFVYDRSWGGLCSLNGLKGVFWMTDFGNGWYNDHHFHYGYMLYALAVIAKYHPDFAEKHKAVVVSIVRDIASPDQNDTYFPFTRHFSWFDGHSFASGIYTLDGGKSQESVSEAINAYYGVYLVGKTFHVPQIEHMGHLLLTLEIRGAQTYWQMPSKSNIYEPIYAANKMTGQVAATKVSYTTWFGPQIEHMHLINMIPFTPITDMFIKPTYVQEEYPLLQQQAFDRVQDPINDLWKGYAYLDLAIINPLDAWFKVQNLTFFDDGNSRTNSLYWIATRPTN
ncbi:endo--beta [Plasmopara halstedii]|uniref:glucan endo-1,3-beta-D-glucosidase n=1 Tax=Plasmopara halstedii TaxID=4781 RepID=A0A0P1B080_PLAHL|nr:endo--beta [Plasmopara halstedii]CEG47048.1 endo--beta [Plasmopara halstedii]|eukprot:XP_024583417.1 endo--beta [Plasmopara halstedii]